MAELGFFLLVGLAGFGFMALAVVREFGVAPAQPPWRGMRLKDLLTEDPEETVRRRNAGWLWRWRR